MNKILNKNKSVPNGVKSGVVYTASTVLTRGLAIITVPIFTRIMTTEQIGVVNMYNSWYALISAFATLSLTSGGFAVAMKEFPKERDRYESSVLSLTSMIAIMLSVIYLVSPNYWQSFFGLDNRLMLLMLLGFLFAPARDFWFARQRYEYKYILPGIISVGTAIVASVLSVVVVLIIGDNANSAVGRLVANYVVVYGVAGVLWGYIFVKGRTIYDKKYWKLSLNLSIPLVGYSVAAQILSVSDRMMIDNFVGKSAVGIYGTLYTVSSLSLLVWQAINASFVPFLFQNMKTKKVEIKRIAVSLLGAYGLIAIILTLIAPEIVKILATQEYYESIYIMPPIAAGIFFYSLSNLYSNIVVYYKKTKYVMFPAIIAAIINVVLNTIFIPNYGYMAAAYTTLFAYIIQTILQMLWARKLLRINGEVSIDIYNDKVVVILAIVITAVCLSVLLVYENQIARWSYLFLILGIVVGGSIYGLKNYIRKE